MALTPSVLTSLATVKTELGLAVTTHDTRLERLITAASEMIADVLGRDVSYSGEVVEHVKGYGTALITLERRPVLAIESVVELGTELAATDYELAVDPTTSRSDSGIVRRLSGENALGTWPWTAQRRPDISQDKLPGSEAAAIVVTYSAGFVTPEQAASANWATLNPSAPTRTLPYVLEEACIELVVSLFRAGGKDRNITLEAVGHAQQSWGQGRDAIPASVMALLAPWARIAGA